MRKRWVALATLCALVVLAQTPAPGFAEALGDDADRVVVQFRTGVEGQSTTGGSQARSLEELGFRTLRVPAGQSRDQFLAELRSQPGVVSAAPEARVFAALAPSDPYYLANQAAYLNQIGTPAAWDLATGNKQIVVAVLDSGTDLAHPDIASRLWENSLETADDGIDHDANGCINDRNGCRFIELTTDRATRCGYSSSARTGAVLDDHGRPGSASHSHGTIVAGIIGAAGNNGVGVTGVAWNVRIMTVKVLDCGTGKGGAPSGDISDVAFGIDYARRMGANVISLSLASAPGDQTADQPILRQAIQAAQDQGIIIVAAAGNHQAGDSQVGPGYPAAYTQYPSVVAVGASDNLNGNTWASYSNYGPAIDFAAPGSNIVSTVRSDLGLPNPYGVAEQGTSFATPLVAGMFALMMSRNSRLAGADYIQIARDTATPAAPAPHGQNWAGSGIINIGAAVARVPLSLSGSVLNDWKDAPAGTDVRASIDGKECGAVLSTTFGVVSRYTLKVKPVAETVGCGEPGKTVRLTIAGVAAVPIFLWGGPDEDIGMANRDISTVSPPPGTIVVQTLNGVWSNIAHLDLAGTLPQSLSYVPNAWGVALHWDPLKPGVDGSGGYQRFARQAPTYVSDWTAVQTYDAYWVNGASANIANINPNPRPGRVIALQAGWNNFVYTGTSAAVADALSDVGGKYTQVLQYDNGARAWLSFVPGQARYLSDFGGLFTLKVYWIFMKEPASLTMR